MSDLRSQVVGLYNTLHEAVKVDPKALAGAPTVQLIRRLAQQAKAEAPHKKAAETVDEVMGATGQATMSVGDAFNLVGQLMKAWKP